MLKKIIQTSIAFCLLFTGGLINAQQIHQQIFTIVDGSSAAQKSNAEERQDMNRIQLIIAVALVAALGMAVTVSGCARSSQSNEQPAQKSEKAVQYTCPMHPEVVQDKPGKCPKCGMDLVEKK